MTWTPLFDALEGADASSSARSAVQRASDVVVVLIGLPPCGRGCEARRIR